MTRRYFGTDGIRGQVGTPPMTVDFALRLASAAARVLAPQGGTVLIGKDTRVSGYMFESALEAGFVAHIAKPFAPNALVATIARAVAARST